MVSAAPPYGTLQRNADFFLRKSDGNSERNSQSPAATAAAQVKRAEREGQEIGAAAAIERDRAHDFVTQSTGNGAHQRGLP